MTDQISGLNRANQITVEKGIDPNVVARAAAANPKAVEVYGGKAAAPVEKARETADKPREEPKEQTGLANMANTRLVFRVDEKTNDVTVLIYDKATDKVVRTIPPDELKNLQQGELVRLEV